MGPENNFYQKRFKFKDLLVIALSFLKNNMPMGQVVPPSMQAFYHAILRTVTMISKDYPEFLSEFHFNLVNSLPDQCI